MEEDYLLRAMASAFWIFMAGVVSATAIWSVRRFMPRKWAYWLTTPLGALIRRLAGRERLESQSPSRPDLEVLDPLPRHPAGRE